MVFVIKTCSKCGDLKPHTEFYRNAKSKDGLRHHCKLCVASYRKPENERSASRRWADNNQEAAMLVAARHRAKKKGMEFNLELSDIYIPNICPVLHIPIVKTASIKRVDGSASLDRIDNTKGYIKGNVEVISWRANCLKRDITREELIDMYDYYVLQG